MRHSESIGFVLWLAVGIFAALPSWATSILTGSVSFDPSAGLYTYSYLLDNVSGPATINELSVLVQTGPNSNGLSGPPAHSDPTAWFFFTAYSGNIALPPVNELGIFWAWHDYSGLPVGSSLAGFSFTTPYGPTPSTANNYFLWSNSYNGGPPCCTGVVEYGHVIAPNLAVPEPFSVLLLGTGLVAGSLAIRRKINM